MSARTLMASATTGVGALVATGAEWKQQSRHPDHVWVYAMFASCGITAVAAGIAFGTWARIVYTAAFPKPKAAPCGPGRSRPGHHGRPVEPPPQPRHASPVDDREDDSHGWNRGRFYAYEMRRWSL